MTGRSSFGLGTIGVLLTGARLAAAEPITYQFRASVVEAAVFPDMASGNPITGTITLDGSAPNASGSSQSGLYQEAVLSVNVLVGGKYDFAMTPTSSEVSASWPNPFGLTDYSRHRAPL